MNKTIDKKKLTSLGIIFFAVALIVCVIGYNPYMKMRAKSKADNYMSENYPVIYRQVKLSGSMSKTSYWNRDKKKFADGWLLSYKNTSDNFMYFDMIFDKKGNIVFDGCGEKYLKGGTIYDYYEKEYQKLILSIMEKELGITEMETDDIRPENRDGSIRFIAGFDPPIGQNLRNPDSYEYYGPVLDLNKKYSTRELGLEYGKIYIAFTEDKGGYEKGAEEAFKRYLQIKEIVEKYQIPFEIIRVGCDFNECLFLTREEFSDYRYTDDLWANYVKF